MAVERSVHKNVWRLLEFGTMRSVSLDITPWTRKRLSPESFITTTSPLRWSWAIYSSRLHVLLPTASAFVVSFQLSFSCIHVVRSIDLFCNEKFKIPIFCFVYLFSNIHCFCVLMIGYVTIQIQFTHFDFGLLFGFAPLSSSMGRSIVTYNTPMSNVITRKKICKV